MPGSVVVDAAWRHHGGSMLVQPRRRGARVQYISGACGPELGLQPLAHSEAADDA